MKRRNEEQGVRGWEEEKEKDEEQRIPGHGEWEKEEGSERKRVNSKCGAIFLDSRLFDFWNSAFLLAHPEITMKKKCWIIIYYQLSGKNCLWCRILASKLRIFVFCNLSNNLLEWTNDPIRLGYRHEQFIFGFCESWKIDIFSPPLCDQNILKKIDPGIRASSLIHQKTNFWGTREAQSEFKDEWRR